jgi:hypothetical protein
MAARWDNKITNEYQTDNPVPSRPDPLTTSKDVVNRATRIPKDFTVTQEMSLWAEAGFPNIDWKTQTEAFIDYWMAQAGQRATKRDWEATWRNWIRNSKPASGSGRSTAAERNLETVRMFEQLEITT